VSRNDRRALPRWAIDLATDGIPLADLRAHGGKEPRKRGRRNVHRAVARVALSAINAGWSFAEFHALLSDPGRQLGNQLRSGGRGRDPRPLREVEHVMRSAWNSAAARATSHPPHAPVEQVARQVKDIRARLDADPPPLPPLDLAVMRLWCDQAERYQTLTPVMPCRLVGETIGIPHRSAYDILRRLDRRDWLSRTEPGHADPNGGSAARYRPGPHTTPHTPLTPPPPTPHTSLGGEDVCGTQEMCADPPDEWDCATGDCPPPEDEP
jgi:hypothetical protein